MPEAKTPPDRHTIRRAASRRSARWGRRRLQRAHFGWPLALALGSSIAGPALAQNLPQGGTVTGGSGTIQQIDANLLQIQQNSQNLAIDWQSFNVGPSGIVRFLQPSSSSIALNRVIGNDPSAIYGQIQANGQVILLNPRGIYFGPNSSVDVNALVATTANIRNDDFMAGRLHFEQGSGDPDARVVNEGLVSVAQGGFAILAAAGVQNTGRIVANGGTVVLAGTRTFTVDFHGDGLLSFAATGTVDQAPSGASALVDNSGIIEAAGGRVLMTARAARDVLDNVINTTGIVVAHTAQMINGEIVIDGGENGIVNVNGTLDASGRNAGETGGTVKVLGEKVGLFADARIDAAGDAGGGTVLVGGNYQGQGPEANARMVYMDAAAMIDASAVTAGNGGKVILWADETTRFDGRISARGGALGGDGGFVETSGKIVLRVGLDAMVDAAAAAGRNGVWLLDPNNISIVSGAGGSTNITGNPSFLSTDDSAQIYDTTINTALDIGNDVTVTTGTGGTNGQAGLITVSGDILNSSGGTRTLTLLTAAGAINITGTIEGTSGNALSVVLDAPTGAVAINGGIDTYGGTLTINAGTAVTQTAAVTSGAGTLSLILNLTGSATANLTNAGNDFFGITLNSTSIGAISIATSTTPQLQTSSIAGDLTLTSATSGFIQAGALTATGGGNVTINGGSGSVTLSQTNSISGPLTIIADSISVTAAQTLVSSVTLQPSTPGTNIVFNGAGAGLQISATTLGNLTGASDLTIGESGSGTLSVANAYTGPGGQNLSLLSGGTMTVAYDISSGGDLSLVSAKNVDISADLTTVGGDIYVAGNVASWAAPYDSNAPVFGSATGSFSGVSIAGGLTIAAGGGDISIAGKGGDSGAGQYGVLMAAGSAIETSGAGNITIAGMGGTPAGGNNHVGIEIGGAVFTTGTGGIKLTGTGGAATGASNQSHGISILATGYVDGGLADVTMTGIGGSMAGSGNTNYGIQMLGQVQTTSGDIALTGTGSDSAGGTNFGVAISGGADVQTAGAGSVTIVGYGGDAAGGLNHGVSISGSGTNVGKTSAGVGTVSITGAAGLAGGTNAGIYIDNNAAIASHNGALTLDGTGGGDGTTTANHGTIIDSGATLVSTSGAITVVGIAGASSGNGNHGIALSAGADVSSASGNILFSANASGTGTNDAINIDNSSVRSTGSADIMLRGLTYGSTGTGILFAGAVAQVGETTMTGDTTLSSDAMATTATSLVLTHAAASGTIVFRPENDATTVGVNGGAGTLSLSSGLLAGIANFQTVGIGTISQTGTIDVAAWTPGRDLQLVSGAGGAITTDALTMGTNALTISNGGAYTQVGGITGSGLVTFFGAGAVTATDPGNSFTDVAFSKTGAAAVSVTTTGALDLAASTLGTGTLNLTSAGLTQSGELVTGGAIFFNAGANAIAFGNTLNAIAGNVRFFNSGANDVTFYNDTATVFGGGTTTVGGNLTVTSDGALTQASALSVAGNATFDATGNTLTLNNAANAVTGNVAFANAADTVTWREAAAVSLAASTSAALSVQAGGAITQVGTLNVTGAATFNAGANAITLNDASNLLQGSVGLTATGGGGHVQLANSVGIAFGSSTIGGNLTVTRTSGTGDVTQSAPLSVGGTTTISMNNGNLTLNQGANSFGGAVSITKTGTGAVTLQNGGPLVLGASSIAGDFSAEANAGAITQTGVLTLGGDFTATAAGALTLDQINGYAVGKNVSLTATGASGAVTISADQVLSSGSFTAVGSAGVAVTAGIETGGGNVTIWGNSPGGVANGVTAGTFYGVSIDTATALIDAGGGNIAIVGAGGSANFQHGVTVRNGAGVETTGAGTITITGRGGSGTGGATAGVEFYAGGAYAQTQNGALTVTGIGGIGGGDNNTGVVLATGEIRATGTGTVTVTGTGGAGGSSGILLGGGGPTVISAVDGNMVLIGTGGSGDDLSGTFGGMHSWGVNLGSNADVKTTGAGNLSITANGGTDGVSDYRIGMVMQSGALVRTSAGTGLINITATAGAGNGGDNSGFIAVGPGTAVRTAAGDLSITATGSGSAGGASNGIVVDGAVVESTSTGNLTVAGTGGYDGKGVVVQGAGGAIQSVDGDVDVTGIGGATAASGDLFGIHVVDVAGAGTIQATGIGSVTLTGTGGAAATANNHGITIETGIVQAGSGGIAFDGTGGGGGTAAGVVFASGGVATTTSGGNVAIDGTGAGNSGIAAFGPATITSAGTLTLSSNYGMSMASADLIVAGTLSAMSTFANVDLSSATNAITGDVALTASGGGNALLSNSLATTLGAMNISGDLTVSSTGNLAQSAAMNVGGASSFASTGGSIVLTNASNVLTGAITVSNASANPSSIVNSTATVINNATTTGDLSVTSGGTIGQIGSVVVVGDLALTADGDITMANPANQSGSVSFATTSGGNVTYSSNAAIGLENVAVAGDLAVDATGAAITQSGVSGFTVGGTTDLTTITSGAITLNQANSFGGAVTLTSAGALDISAIQTVGGGGSFDGSAAGAITLGSGGGVTTTAGDIGLYATANVAMNTSSLSSNGGNITIVAGPGGFTGAEFLSTSINAGGGDISITGQGMASGSSQHGIWIGSGTNVTTTGAGDITLTGTGGAAAGGGNVGVFVYAGSVQAQNGTVTVLGQGAGAASSDHGVAVASGGQITSTGGAIFVTGDGSTGGGGNGVWVDGTGSKIESGSGSITVAGTGATSGPGNDGIRIANAGYIGSTTGSIGLTGDGGGTSGIGVVLADGIGTGGILSSGAATISVVGSGTGGQAGIASSGSLSIVGGGSSTGGITLQTDEIDLASGPAIQTAGMLTIDTLTPGLSIGINNSASSLNIDGATFSNVTAGMVVIGGASATGQITIGADATNSYGENFIFHNGAGAPGVAFNGAFDTSGDLTVMTGGTITQTAAVTVVGMAGFVADGNITLGNAANAMIGGIGFSSTGGNVTISNTGPTDFHTSDASGTLTVAVTGGHVSQLGPISVGGATSVTSAAAISWSNAGNVFGGPLTLTNTGNYDISIAATGPVELGNVSMSPAGTGSLSVSADGLTQGGGTSIVSGTGNVTLAGGSGSITLEEVANAFNGNVALSGTGGALEGTVKGATGTDALQFVTASSNTFTFNGAEVGVPVVAPGATGTQAILNEIAAVAPIDSATRIETPATNNAGLGGPAFDQTNSASTAELSGGTAGGTGDDQTESTNVAGGTPAPLATGGQGQTAPGGTTGAAGGPSPPTILVSSDAGTGGPGTNDVNANPAPQPSSVTLVQGVLTSVTGTPSATAGALPGISDPVPQLGNSANWGASP